MNAKKALKAVAAVLIVVIVLTIIGAWVYQVYNGGAAQGVTDGVKTLLNDFLRQQISTNPWWEGDAAGALFWLIILAVFIALALFYFTVLIANGY
ncbi:MAG: hypothetical protein AAB490_03265 [Patescibacteria group bacterium]